MSGSREHFRELTLGFLWRQWSALGVAGHARPADNWIIDPEALLLATTSLGRDPRLFDEVLDWLNTNGQAVNLQRLQNLSHRFGQRTILGAMAAHLARRTVHSKWKTLLRVEKSAAGSELLFPGVPVVGPPDELFAHFGWLRGPVKFRQLSQAADPHQPTNLLFKLRALFGIQARAEVMAYLLAFESGHPREMAERLAYFPRTIQTALNDMACSGHVLSRREGHEKRFWLRRDEWRFLLTGSARDGAGSLDFPRWIDWASFFVAIEAVWNFLNRSDLDGAAPAIRAIELRGCLDKLDPAFLRENVGIPAGASGAAFVEAVLNSFHRLLQ